MSAFAQKVKSGDLRTSLEAMRDKLADDMEKADFNVVAQIAARLQAVLTQLDNLPSAERSDADELSERRKARGSAANAKMRAKQRERA
jgi:hypothetical protein